MNKIILIFANPFHPIIGMENATSSSMETIVVDLAVIGSGPAGQKGAIQAAKLGKSVVVIEKDPFLGGACLNTATIPSKSLREAIIDLTRYHERNFIEKMEERQVTAFDLNTRLGSVIEGERAVVLRQFSRNRVRYITGFARFNSPHELAVLNEAKEVQFIIQAKFILMAVGSRPRTPVHFPFDNEVILDSTSLLAISKVPKTMLVLGGGVVGSEYASFFSVLGSKVTILDKKERLLPSLDAEIGFHLQTGLKEIGLHFIPKMLPEKIERVGKKAKVTCQDGTIFETDCLLYALGREANIGGLNIENVGIQLTPKGYIQVDEDFQTAIPHIYAAGDVIGYPSLASTSMEQGRLAIRHAFGVKSSPFPSFFPLGIYTIPEISSCGATEEELQKKGFHYGVGRAYYYEIAKSHITGSTSIGLFKILFHAETTEVLGVHIVGRNATELIHIGLVAMAFRAKLDFFVDQVFNYPTFAEGYRIAALNGINKIKNFRWE